MSTPSDVAAPVRRGPSPRMAVALLLTINLFNYIDRYILAAVEPEIRKHFFGASASGSAASAREELAASMAKTGSLATAFLVSYMLAAPAFGWLATRMSRWVLVAISVAVWSLASGASGLAQTFAILVVTRCFVGIGEAGYGPAAPSMISELYPVERRGTVLAWFYMAIPVGSALGYVLGGAVSKHLGWRWPFFIVVMPGLLLALWALFMRSPRVERAESVEGHRKAGLKDYLAILKIPSYLLNTAGMTAMTFAIGGFSFWMPAYLVDHAHAGDLADVNFKFGAITAVTGVVATLAGGFLGDYFRRYTSGAYFIVSAIGILVSAVCVVVLVQTSRPGPAGQPNPMLWFWLTLTVFFLFLNTGPTNTALANVTHPSVRANGFALNILLIHALGDAISPPILGAVAGRSWDHALYLVSAVMALAAVFWMAGAPFLKRDTDRVERQTAGVVSKVDFPMGPGTQLCPAIREPYHDVCPCGTAGPRVPDASVQFGATPMARHGLGRLLSIAFACAFSLAAGAAVNVGDKPQLRFVAANGAGPVSLEKLKGKIVVVDFWATWCQPCMAEADHMVAVNAQYAPKGLQFIGISLDSDVQAMRRVAQEKGFNWPQMCDAQGWQSLAAKEWGVTGIPQTFILDPDGTVVWQGFPSDLDAALAKAFEKTPPRLVDPKVLADATAAADKIDAALKAGGQASAAKLLGSIPAEARKDAKLADRLAEIEKQLEDYANKSLAEVDPLIEEKKYVEAAGKLQDLTRALGALPSGATAKKRLAELMSNPQARAQFEAAQKTKTAEDELAIAKRFKAEGKAEQAYLKFKSVTTSFAGTPAGDAAKAEVAGYEKDPAFVAKMNDSAAATKAKAALGLAASYEKAGRTDVAKQKYQDIIKTYPKTPWAAQAQAALDEIARKQPR